MLLFLASSLILDMASYSPKSLIDKLGVKPGMKIAIVGSPPGFKSALVLPRGVEYAEHGRDFNIVMYFSNSFGKLRAKMRTLRRMIKEDGAIWICWPKSRRDWTQSSPLLGDFKEDDIRKLALSLQLVDVKVVAVNETWSGLKLVVPVALRIKRIT